MIFLLRNVESAGSKQHKPEQSVYSDEELKKHILKTSGNKWNVDSAKVLSKETGLSFKNAVNTILKIANINPLDFLDDKITDADTKTEIRNHIRSGNKILAIKIMKDKLDFGLNESKQLCDLIEKYMDENNLQ